MISPLQAEQICSSICQVGGRRVLETRYGQLRLRTLMSPRQLNFPDPPPEQASIVHSPALVQSSRHDAPVWTIAGDGGFQMTSQELATMAQENLPVKIALLNNGYLGMVRQWQELFFDNHIKEVPISGPDYVKLAHAYGIAGERVLHQEDVMPALRQAQNHPGPYLIEFVVDPAANVYPMVPPGGSLADTLEDPLTKLA